MTNIVLVCDVAQSWEVSGLLAIISSLQGFFILGLVSVTHFELSKLAPKTSHILVSGLISSLGWLFTLFQIMVIQKLSTISSIQSHMVPIVPSLVILSFESVSLVLFCLVRKETNIIETEESE